MSGYCKDCKHWELLPTTFYRGPQGWGECRAAEGEDAKAVRPATLAYAIVVETHEAGLLTAPEFGCVMFEARE